MNYKELDVVELIADAPEYGMKAGSVGTIVDVYADGEFEVEFTDEEGDTIACLSVKSWQIKLRKRQDSINRFSAMYRNDRDMFDFVVGLVRHWQP